MATESIFFPIVIDDQKAARRFEQAIKESESAKAQCKSQPATFTQPTREMIRALFR